MRAFPFLSACLLPLPLLIFMLTRVIFRIGLGWESEGNLFGREFDIFGSYELLKHFAGVKFEN